MGELTLPLCLVKDHTVNAYGGMKVYLHSFEHQWKSRRYPLVRRLSGLQSRSGRCVEEKTFCLYLEWNHLCPPRRYIDWASLTLTMLYSRKWCLPLASTWKCRELGDCGQKFCHLVEYRLAGHRDGCLPMIHCSGASNMTGNCHLGRCCK
jgi:hypothetical protein